MSFKDHFSQHAGDYARFRPLYPAALFQYLASTAPGTELAWDCATGNGQAAVALAEVFDHVIATDASSAQLGNATPNPKVEYRLAHGEESGLAAQSADLITVAQALHWLDIPRFFDEASRVLKPRGVIAFWGYELMNITPGMDRIMRAFYNETVGPYWPPERKIVEDGYRTVEVPFEELDPPPFNMVASWTLFDFVGYIRTWSAVQRFIKSRGFDPVEQLTAELAEHWGPPFTIREIAWPLNLRVGRNSV
jgi:ubiquinone/menaquinone biosynthesis C-methylase UbiE